MLLKILTIFTPMNLIMRPTCLQKILLLIKKENLTDFWYNYDNNIK